MDKENELKGITKEQLRIIRLDTAKAIFTDLDKFIEPIIYRGNGILIDMAHMNLKKYKEYQKEIIKDLTQH